MKNIRLLLLAFLFSVPSLNSQAANRYWVGALTGNWSSTLNWSTSSGGLPLASVPGINDIAIFDGGGLGLNIGNCTINVPVSVTGITISAGYTGTISQGTNSIAVSGAATFGGGTFTGGSANISITGAYTLSGTAFKSTSAIMQLNGNAAFTSGTFAHNNGVVKFSGAAAETLSGTSPVFYTLEFAGTGHTYTISSTGNVGVVNALNISGAASCTLNTGVFAVSGNINLTNTSAGDGGTATIDITGASNQAIVSALPVNESTLPSVTINKTGGTLTLPALITVMGNWTYTAGTIDAATNSPTVVFAGTLNITGSHTLDNITFEGNNNWTYTIDPATTLTANGDMSLTGIDNLVFTTGTINLNGNLNLTNTATGGGGTTVIAFTGTGNQAINSVLPVNQSSLPAININKASGILTFPGLITARGNWTYTTGTIDVTTNNSTVVFASALGTGALGITGNQSLNNVTLEGNNNNTVTVNTGTIITVTGTLSTTGAFNVFINTTVAGATAIGAQGNITINNTSVSGGGTGLILINGTGNQAFTSTAAASQGLLPYLTIQKPSGTLTLTGIFSETRDWTWSSGMVDATTNASTVVFGGNNLTITSTGMSFYNITLTANTSTLAGSLSVNNNLTIGGLSVLAPGANTINLSGNWSDWGTAGFAEATSTVNFNGSALQTITTPGGENFTNVIVNNTGPGIQLASTVSIAKALTMTQGNIGLNSNALTLGTGLASAGTLNYTAGTMINTGSFTRWIPTAAIAGTTGLFPMGTATDYRPMSIYTTVTPTTGGTITVAYTDATTNTAVSFPDGASTVSVRKDLHWTVTTGSTLAGGTYSLKAAGTGFGTIGNVADLRLTLANSISGADTTNGGTTANPQVYTTLVSFGNLSNSFYVASVNSLISSLPVTWLSFTGSVLNGDVVLDWSTATETNNAWFMVQRSTDAVNWQNLEQVAGAGTSSTPHSYTAMDRNPYRGSSFYRVLQTDRDGNQAYSIVLSVSVENTAPVISVYPNPTADDITVSFATTGKYEITLLNSAGQRMNRPVLSTGNPVILPVSTMKAGVYFIRMRYQDKTETKKILIVAH